MKKFAAICLLLLTALQARADLTIIENIDSAGQGQDLTMNIKGDKARVDMGSGQMSIIIDASTGDMISLIHSQKMFMKISGDKAKALMAQIKKKDDNAEVPKIVDTGKTEKVGDYSTEVYTANTDDMKCTFWVTKGIPNLAAVQAQLKKMQALQDKLGQGKGPDISKIDGVPVKTQVVKNGVTTTVSLIAIKQEPVDDAYLMPPPDYTEMPVPDFPDGGGAPPPQPPQAPQPPQQFQQQPQ
jgi:hypothetical protein